MQSGSLELQGSIYVIDRTTSPLPLLGGTKVARLKEVVSYKMGQNVSIHRKGNVTPSMSRITGDYIEVEATFEDIQDEVLALITNNRSTGQSFLPASATYKYGHILREADYSAIVIRDEEAPADYPALYIPYALCFMQGWFAARAAGHMAFMNIMLSSMDVNDETDGNPFEYGDITTFAGYVAP